MSNISPVSFKAYIPVRYMAKNPNNDKYVPVLKNENITALMVTHDISEGIFQSRHQQEKWLVHLFFDRFEFSTIRRKSQRA